MHPCSLLTQSLTRSWRGHFQTKLPLRHTASTQLSPGLGAHDTGTQGLRTACVQGHCPTPRHRALLTGLPLGPSSPGGPLGPGGPAAPEGPASPFSPLSPLGPCGGRGYGSVLRAHWVLT